MTMESYYSKSRALAFAAPSTFCSSATFLSSRDSAWCQRIPRGRAQPVQQRKARVQKRLVVRAEATIANTILRALENEFVGQDIARVAQSFRNIMDGHTLEVDKDTPRHQRATSFVEGLDAVPFIEDYNGDFKWVERLEENCDLIAKEMRQVTGQEDIKEKGNNIWVPPVVEAANAYGPDWRTLVLQDRTWDPVNTKLFPETSRILRDKDFNVPSVEAFFARQSADTGIKLHTDDCNFILTMHLALSAPDKQSWIEVAGERRYWENGKALVFNTSYFHQTMNESQDEDRIVLLIRFWHPQLSAAERTALSFLFQVIDQPDTHPAVLRASRQLKAETQMSRKGSGRRSGGRGFGR